MSHWVRFCSTCPISGCSNSLKIIYWTCSKDGSELYINQDGYIKCGKNGCIRKDDYQDIIRIKAEVKLQKILENNLNYKERSNDKKNEEWLVTLKDCNTIDSFLDYLKANYRFYLKNIPWERGYNAVNIDNKENCYKFLFV